MTHEMKAAVTEELGDSAAIATTTGVRRDLHELRRLTGRGVEGLAVLRRDRRAATHASAPAVACSHPNRGHRFQRSAGRRCACTRTVIF